MFSVIHDIQTSANNLNKNLEVTGKWATQSKMKFNPDTTKQAQEVIYPPLLFNNVNVTWKSSQKYLGIILATQLKFDNHLKMGSGKISKTTGILRKLQNLLPRAALITIKVVIRHHLDYGDIVYGQAYNMSFQQKPESIQYNACFAITGHKRDTSKEKSLQLRRWYRKLWISYKIFKSKSPLYLLKLLPEKQSSYVTRNPDNISLFNIKHNFYNYFFFLLTIIEWNNMDSNLRNSENNAIFKNDILKFIRPKPKIFFNCYNLKGIRLIKRLCLELSHLPEHKFKFNFQNCLNPICRCGVSIESTSHVFLHCPTFNDKRDTLLNTLIWLKIDWKILKLTDSYLTQTLLCGCTLFDIETNTLVLKATILYSLSTGRFEEPLF